MKGTFRLLALFGVAVGVVLACGGIACAALIEAPGDTGRLLPESQGFALQLALSTRPAPPYQVWPGLDANKLVMLHCSLRNVSREPLSVAEASPEFDYHLTVTDEHGKVVAPEKLMINAWMNVVLEVAPGEELTAIYNLTWVYGVLPDGEYSIMARRYVSGRDGKHNEVVASNTIGIEMLQGKAVQVSSRPRAPVAAPGDSEWLLPESQGFALQLQLGATGKPDRRRSDLSPAWLVWLRLSLRNVTTEPLLVAGTFPEHDYLLTVTNAFGEVVASGRDVGDVARRSVLEIAPGEELAADYNFSWMYGGLPDGEYSIVARRYVLGRDGEGVELVASNPILLSISGGKPLQTSPGLRKGGGPSAKRAGPMLMSERDLLPVRPILERHGFRVSWEAAKQTMTVTRGKVVATLRAGQDFMMLRGQKTRLGRPAQIVEGRLSVPGQAISMITGLASEERTPGRVHL